MNHLLNKFSSVLLLGLVTGCLAINSYAANSNESNNTDKTPQRIIALAPHIVEMLFSLGVGDRIVGTTDHADYPVQAKKIPLVGNYARLKIEKILAYHPDLIIAWKTGNPSDDLERLSKLGVKIVYSDPKNLTDVASELRLFGKLTGTGETAEIQAQKFELDLKRLQKSYANKAPISVFYELWPNPLTTVANNAWPQQHLNVCGATNPFIDGVADYPQIGLEHVVMAKPQLIIQPTSAGETTPDAVDWSQFIDIPASKHRQLIKPNSDKLHRMTPRLLVELEKLCMSIDKARNYYLALK
jgi:vitamin B12 transport system substrate-binding protein